jgi:hypothetical protein
MAAAGGVRLGTRRTQQRAHRALLERGRRAAARYHNLCYCYGHSAIKGYTCLAYGEDRDDETTATALATWTRARVFCTRHRITVEQLLNDHGSADRSDAWPAEQHRLGIKHFHTQARRLHTNGRTERHDQTLLEEWAYRGLYTSEKACRAALSGWLHHYNSPPAPPRPGQLPDPRRPPRGNLTSPA